MGFSNLEAIKTGLEKTKRDLFIAAAITAVALIYWTVPFYIARSILGISEAFGTILVLIFLVLSFLIFMGYIKTVIDIYDGNSVDLKDLFMHYKKLPDFIIGFLFYFVIVSLTSVLLVIPGIFFAVRLSFVFFFILQGDSSALESLKKSWKITGGEFFSLLIFYLLLVGINILGASIFFVGLAFSLPVSLIAVVYAYRELSLDYKRREIEKMATLE